jgi:hypothetical protein
MESPRFESDPLSIILQILWNAEHRIFVENAAPSLDVVSTEYFHVPNRYYGCHLLSKAWHRACKRVGLDRRILDFPVLLCDKMSIWNALGVIIVKSEYTSDVQILLYIPYFRAFAALQLEDGHHKIQWPKINEFKINDDGRVGHVAARSNAVFGYDSIISNAIINSTSPARYNNFTENFSFDEISSIVAVWLYSIEQSHN